MAVLEATRKERLQREMAQRVVSSGSLHAGSRSGKSSGAGIQKARRASTSPARSGRLQPVLEASGSERRAAKRRQEREEEARRASESSWSDS